MSGEQSVLVVEDDEGLANIIALILGQEGFDVRTAHNGTLGYFAYFHEPTEWVVTDIQMPELDGLQMMQGIRSINPNVKVVYMSGEVDKYHMALDQEISEFGAGVLRKPFTKGNLIDEIAAARKGFGLRHSEAD
jgi:DNA-binding NtrC family response regulator